MAIDFRKLIQPNSEIRKLSPIVCNDKMHVYFECSHYREGLLIVRESFMFYGNGYGV